jgi:23S rRNA (adenine2503-C2)-methyltransferase
LKKKKYILGIDKDNLNECIGKVPDFRLKQIQNWFYQNFIFSPLEMKNLPKNLRDQLAENYTWEYPKIIEISKTSDKTEKYLLELNDGEHIEFVIISTPKRKTLCLSTQVGCPIQCRFCASGAFGLKRNLTEEEILYQFLFTCQIIGKVPDNVVFMGIGEPLLNFDNLVSALDKICSPEYTNYAARRITISTSGIPKQIRKLAEIGKQWNLAVSIHAPDDLTRSLVIPDKTRYPLPDIFEACKYYFEKTGRLITLEYTLIAGVNDKVEHAKKLASLAKTIRSKINMIPYNPVPGTDYKRPSDLSCRKFAAILEQERGVICTLRIEKGSKIDAACGQLRIKKII